MVAPPDHLLDPRYYPEQHKEWVRPEYALGKEYDMPSYAVKIDANHAAIRTAAQEHRVWLLDTYQFAQYHGGFPDMLWLSPQTGETWYIEVKNGFDEPLTKKEHAFADMIRAKNGVYLVIHSLDEAIALLKAMRRGG